MVAPTSTTVPSSITGRNKSCCARLKRCTSSTNSSVPLPVSRRARAASNAFFRSATPENTAESCSKCSSVASAKQPRHRGLAGARRSPEDQRTQRARLQHARQRAVGSQDVILADDFRQRARAQPVRQRMRRILLHARGGEQVGSFAWSFRAHPPSVTLICWPPRTSVMRQSRADFARRLFEIAGLGDLLVVDGQDDVALLESDIGGRAAIGEIGHHDAFGVGIQMQLVGHRRRDIGDLGALERRARRSARFRCGRYRARFPAAPSASPACRRAARRSAPCRRADASQNGSRTHWDPRPPGRRSRRSGRTVSVPPAPPGCSGRRWRPARRSEAAAPASRRSPASPPAACAPSHGRLTALPPLLAEATTTRTMLAGIAKPMPCDPPEREKIAVLMPASLPVMSTSAPPELPGLIAASVWMKNW